MAAKKTTSKTTNKTAKTAKARATNGSRLTNERPVVVFTEYKGVFFGYVTGNTDDARSVTLRRSKMLINFRNGKGVFQVTSEGPVDNCLVSAPCPSIRLHGVTGVAEVTAEAEKVWNAK